MLNQHSRPYPILRIWAALSLLAICLLIAMLYIPATNKLGNRVLLMLGGDQTVHVLVGFVLPLALGFLARLYLASKRLQWAYWCSCLLLFGMDELAQSFSPLRKSDPQDFMMSALGWLIAVCCWWLLRGRP